MKSVLTIFILLLAFQGGAKAAQDHSTDYIACRVFSLFETDSLLVVLPDGASRELSIRDLGFGCDGSFTLAIPGRIMRRFSGSFRLRLDGSGRLAAVVSMPLEKMTSRIVAAECEDDSPAEFLALMAVLVRSRLETSRRASTQKPWDVVDSTSDALFFGEDLVPITRKSKKDSGFLERCEAACRETEGMVLTYQGRLQQGFFSAACGSRTLHPVMLWGEDERWNGYSSVICPACYSDKKLKWERKLEPLPGASFATFAERERARIAYGRRFGPDSIPSNNFEVVASEPELVLEGKGSGHGAGLCMNGARKLAEQGNPWKGILKYFIPGCNVSPLGD